MHQQMRPYYLIANRAVADQVRMVSIGAYGAAFAHQAPLPTTFC